MSICSILGSRKLYLSSLGSNHQPQNIIRIAHNYSMTCPRYLHIAKIFKYSCRRFNNNNFILNNGARKRPFSCNNPLGCRSAKFNNSARPVKPKKEATLEWQILVLMVGRAQSSQALDNLKKLTNHLVRLVVKQLELHASQRLRRSVQLYSVYSRMWGEEMTKQMLSKFKNLVLSKSRHFLLSAVCLSRYDWKNNNISDEKISRCASELNEVDALCKATIYCDKCNKRLIVNNKRNDVSYCSCSSGCYVDGSQQYDNWEAFLERDHILVWRRRHPVHSHLYSYKVYGTYSDLSLNAFLEVQLNTKYRPEWDDSVIRLEICDSHPQTNSDLLYWVVKFPTFFANRDYVFKRRFRVNEERKEVSILNECIEYDGLPQVQGLHRVEDYWSIMVIRSISDFDKPGIEYTLTYFDNPGTSLPTSFTNFIASTGFPNYLEKVYKAAKLLQSQHENGKDTYVSLPSNLRFPKKERTLEIISTPEIGLLPEEEEERAISKSLTAKQGSQLVFESQQNDYLPKEKLIEASENVIQNLEAQKVVSKDDNKIQDKTSDTKILFGDKKRGSIANLKIIEEKSEFMKDVLEDEKKTEAMVNDTSILVALASKKVVVDLLEAMEVVAPDLEKKSFIAKRLEELAQIGKENIEKNTKLIEKLDELRRKIAKFKQKTLKISSDTVQDESSSELKTRKTHYDHNYNDDAALIMLQNLFEAMADILEEDKNMRTGKGYAGGDKNQKNSHKKQDTGEESSKHSNESTNTDAHKKKNNQDLTDRKRPPPRGGDGMTKPDPSTLINDYNKNTPNQPENNKYTWQSWPLISYVVSWFSKSETKSTEFLNDGSPEDYLFTDLHTSRRHESSACSSSLHAHIKVANTWNEKTFSNPEFKSTLVSSNHEELSQLKKESIEYSTNTQGYSWVWYPINSGYKVILWIGNLFSPAKAIEEYSSES